MTNKHDEIVEKDILFHVNKICHTPDFKSKRILCRFLRFVVKEKLAGRGDQIKGYTIGIEVLKKDETFDPEQDSLVRIHAGRLRRSLKLYYMEEGKNDPIRIEIPKGSNQPNFILVDQKKLNVRPETNSTPEIPRESSIAVVPFQNLNGDPAKAYFAHGFSEELSIELTKYEDLKIINCWHRPESNISNFKNLYTIYGARFILDGGVQIILDKISILVKLLDAKSGRQIWADRYNRNLDINHLVEIEESIAEKIAKTVGSEIGIVTQQLSDEISRLKPAKLSVFDAILRFYYYDSILTLDLAIETFQYLQQALEDDPNSGIIQAMIASMLGTSYALDYPNSEGAYEKMDEFAEKAIAMDPNSQIVRIIYVSKCFMHNEKDRFMQELSHCLSLKMTSPFRQGILGFYLCLYGEWERGKSILDKAMNKSIGYPLFFHGATSLYFYRIDDFSSALDEAMKYDVPSLFWSFLQRIACLGQLNQKGKALNQIQYLTKLKPDFETKAKYLISRYIKEEDLVLKVMDGLRKAGMKV